MQNEGKILTSKESIVQTYQLDQLSRLLDKFEEKIDLRLSGKLKWEDDYPNVLFQAAGKASLTFRAIIYLSTEGLPDAALALARNIYEQAITLYFFEEQRNKPDFEKYIEDYFLDYDLQINKFHRWAAEQVENDEKKKDELLEEFKKLKDKANHEVKGDYWWTGQQSFSNVVKCLINATKNRGFSKHFAIAHLCYLRACKDVHPSALGNRLRLGSSPDLCGIDNSAKATGHGLPLYFATSSFVLILLIVFGFFGIDVDDLYHGFEQLEDLYAELFSKEEPTL